MHKTNVYMRIISHMYDWVETHWPLLTMLKQLEYLTLIFFIQFWHSFVCTDKGNITTTDKFHTDNTRFSTEYHQYIHNLESGNYRPTIAGGRFGTKLPIYIKQIKESYPFKKKLK
jgi:hypothetical protein